MGNNKGYNDKVGKNDKAWGVTKVIMIKHGKNDKTYGLTKVTMIKHGKK